MCFVLCRKPPIFLRITVAGSFLCKPVAEGQCCSVVLRVPGQTDGFQIESARSRAKQALLSCLESSLESTRKTWHNEAMGRAAALPQWDVGHCEDSSPCKIRNGSCPFETVTTPEQAAFLTSWCPSCGTEGSQLGGLGGLLGWSRQWVCSSLCDLRNIARDMAGWASLRGISVKGAAELKPHRIHFSVLLSWLCSNVKWVTWRFEEEQTVDKRNHQSYRIFKRRHE